MQDKQFKKGKNLIGFMKVIYLTSPPDLADIKLFFNQHISFNYLFIFYSRLFPNSG